MHVKKIKENILMAFHDKRLTLKRPHENYPTDMRKNKKMSQYETHSRTQWIKTFP